MDLEHVVDQAHQLPLRIDLLFSPEAKSLYTNVCIDVAKYGFDGAWSLAIDMSPQARVYLLFHLLNQALFTL